jgi:hypothetical protein
LVLYAGRENVMSPDAEIETPFLSRPTFPFYLLSGLLSIK